MRSLATTVVTVALAGALLSACGDDGSPAAEPSTASATPAMSQSVTPGDPPSPSESGGSDDHDPDARSLPYRGGNVAGNWETGDLLGERLPAGRRFGRRQVMYAVTGSSKDGHALISLGLVEGGRIFRILPALVPEAEEAPDGIDLYGGNRLEDGTYELMGAVPGTVTIAIETPDGRSTEATSQSDAVLPGWTVFHHRGQWQQGWDEISLAPVAVTTDAGARVEARERSWVG